MGLWHIKKTLIHGFMVQSDSWFIKFNNALVFPDPEPPFLKNFELYGSFLWMGFNCLKATGPLRGGSLLFTTKFPEIPGTHLIDLRRMKGWVNLGVTQWFWTQNLWIWNQAPFKNLIKPIWIVIYFDWFIKICHCYLKSAMIISYNLFWLFFLFFECQYKKVAWR